MEHTPPSHGSMRRRLMHWLSGMSLLPLAGGLLAQAPGRSVTPLRTTPEDDLGPFYPPDWGGDIDADLTRLNTVTTRAEGQHLQLGGVVRDTNGHPVADAAVEIWQADSGGRYRHPGVDPRTRDAGFQGYGRTMTDADGRYIFLTIMPGKYGSRPPHIHFRVAQPGRAEFVTQMYFRGNNREGNGFAPPEREALTVDLVPEDQSRPGGTLSARFDLVLAAR